MASHSAIPPEVLTQASIDTLGQPQKDPHHRNITTHDLPNPEQRIVRQERYEYRLSGDVGKHILLKLYQFLYSRYVQSSLLSPFDSTSARVAMVTLFNNFHGLHKVSLASLLGISNYTNSETKYIINTIFENMSPEDRYKLFTESFYDQTQMRLFIENLNKLMKEFETGRRSKCLCLAWYDQSSYMQSRGEAINERVKESLPYKQGFQFCALLESDLNNPSEPLPDSYSEPFGLHITISRMAFTKEYVEKGFSVPVSNLMHITDQGFQITERTWYLVDGRPAVSYVKLEVERIKLTLSHFQQRSITQFASAKEWYPQGFVPEASIVQQGFVKPKETNEAKQFIAKVKAAAEKAAAAKKGGRKGRRKTRHCRKRRHHKRHSTAHHRR